MQNMRRTLLAPIAIVICLSVQAQDYKSDIRTQFQQYLDLIHAKNFAKSMDYVNPSLFKYFPKDQLVQSFEAVFNDPQIEVAMEKAEILSIGEKQTINGASYVKMRYLSPVKMKFITAPDQELDTAMVKGLLEQQFGAGQVLYDAKTKFYKITKQENVVANSADNKKWTFIVVDPKLKSTLEKFIPKELL